MSPNSELQPILVLEPDRLRAAIVARAVSRVFAGARVYCESDTGVAAKILAEQDIGLFIVGLRGFDLDILTLLGVWAEQAAARTRVLIMTPHIASTAVMALRTLPITGIFDSSSGDLRELEFACRTVASGETYWCRPYGDTNSEDNAIVATQVAEPPTPPRPASRPVRSRIRRRRFRR